MLEQDYTRIFKGRIVDMRLHDLVIGSRESILKEYDKVNETGVIPQYK